MKTKSLRWHWRRFMAAGLALELLFALNGPMISAAQGEDLNHTLAQHVFKDDKVAVKNGANASGAVSLAPYDPTPINPSALGPGTGAIPPKPAAEMSKFERIAWGIAKALIPTMTAVVGTALLGIGTGGIGFIVAPFLLGGVSSALVNYAYEARMNSAFRSTPKDSKRLFRDVFTTALADGIMAPFTVATGGLGAVAGQVTTKSIVAGVAKMAALTFAGKVTSSAVSGGVKHALNKYWIHNDQAIAAKEAEMRDVLLEIKKNPADDGLLARYLALEREAAELRAEDYNWKNLRKDVEQAAWSGLVSGVVGGTAMKLAAETPIAKVLSQKMFNDTSHAEQIARIVTDLPVRFVDGTGNAKIDQIEIDREIAALKARRQAFAEGTPEQVIIDRRIADLQTQRDEIDILRAGAKTALTGLAINGVTLASQYGIYKYKQRPQPSLTAKEQTIARGERTDAVDIKQYKEKMAEAGADPGLVDSNDPYAVAALGKRDGVKLVVKPSRDAPGATLNDAVVMRKGDATFGWTHISMDRPDGVNHAKEIAAAFKLSDTDASVKKLIVDTIETGAAVPDTTRGSINFIKSFGDGRAIKVVVSATTNPGSVITAYLAGGSDLQLARDIGNVDLSKIDFTNPGKLNINSAGVANIDMLRGMPTAAAQAIVQWRQANGPITSLDDLLKIPGVDGNALKLCRDYIAFK